VALEALNWRKSKLEPDEKDRSIDLLLGLYNAKMKEYNAIDYNDMLLMVARKLRDDEEFAKLVRSKYQYIFVDEYQDTNQVQFSILKSLAGHTGKITVVGDDDQTIYSCKLNVYYYNDNDIGRGAEILNWTQFKDHFNRDNQLAEVKLETNYRSTTTIVDASSAVIINNKQRIPKKMHTRTYGF
jgi:superfamily I DNA/RNA helicase